MKFECNLLLESIGVRSSMINYSVFSLKKKLGMRILS